jgi:hypothetical protein
MGALESHQGISRGKTIRVAPVLVFPLHPLSRAR